MQAKFKPARRATPVKPLPARPEFIYVILEPNGTPFAFTTDIERAEFHIAAGCDVRHVRNMANMPELN